MAVYSHRMPAVRAIVVEDDPFARATVAASLRLHGVDVVAECGNAGDAVRAAETHAPDVAVTDLDLGGGPNGMVVAHALRRALPSIGVVMLTSYSDPRMLGATLAQVPEGTEYVVKQSVTDTAMLGLAIDRAILAAPGATRPRPVTAAPTQADLTDVQLETLRLVAEGLTTTEIARRRGVSAGSVERTIARVGRILGVEAGEGENQRVLLTRAFLRLTGRDHAPAG